MEDGNERLANCVYTVNVKVATLVKQLESLFPIGAVTSRESSSRSSQIQIIN